MNDILVLVGHGSSDGESEDVVRHHAARIQELGIFSHVYACSLHNMLAIKEILQNIKCNRVFVVPMFIAHGRHTKETIPKAFGIKEGHSTINSAEIIYCEPIGYNDKITDIILEQVAEKKD
ncbi:MAG: sirohydrochlorin cobaltochelatase [Methanosarcinales archaeon]|nr:MAG: sirohydrochlorin cobaltochelatase [Methanosarcinales archaeon]